MATVTIDINEFDEMRNKAKMYDELKQKYDAFPEILKHGMLNVLSKVIEIKSGITDYSKKPKLNIGQVVVSPDVAVIKKMEIQIDELKRGGYYDANIICHY